MREKRMLRTFVNGKIHQLKVTGLQPSYNGSCLICPDLLAAAGIEPFEKVEIYSLTSTARIATYVFPGAAEGEFTLNGGAACISGSGIGWPSWRTARKSRSAARTG